MTTADMALTRAQLRRDVLSGRARAIREDCHLTQAEVAAAIQVTQSAVAAWEAGRRLPRGSTAERYAALLWRLDALTRSAP